MSCWQIREVRELGLGKDGRLFTLSKDRPLTIGQADDSVLQLKVRQTNTSSSHYYRVLYVCVSLVTTDEEH